MQIIEPKNDSTNIKTKIRDAVTRMQFELEALTQEILHRAGNKIQPEQREDVESGVNRTKQLLERLKSIYS